MPIVKKALDIDGYKIEYKSSGNGFPLVLIHTHHPYAKYFLSSLPKNTNYQVITLDIPGYYSAGQKKPVETIDQFINLLDKLFARLEFKRVDLIGECLGSVIVLKYAVKYPKRVRKLILVSLPLRVFGSKVKKTVGPLFFFLRKYRLAGNFAKTLIRFNLWRGITNYFGGYQGFWALFKQETLRVSQWNFDPRVFWGILANLFEIDIEKLVGKIKSKAIFIIGDKDRVTQKKKILKFCQQRKDASCEIIHGANHALVTTHTRRFNQIITKFLFKKELPTANH